MANFTLIIDAEDFSDYIQQETDITETMTKVIGPAQAEAVDGTTIPDLVRVKWNPSFLLMPMPKTKMQNLIAMMQLETVDLVYTSVVNNTTRNITAMPVSMKVKFATRYGTQYIYEPTPISFEEV